MFLDASLQASSARRGELLDQRPDLLVTIVCLQTLSDFLVSLKRLGQVLRRIYYASSRYIWFWRMAGFCCSICYSRLLCFQGFRRSTLCPCGAPHFRFCLNFLAFFTQSGTRNFVPIVVKKCQDCVGHRQPFLGGTTSNPCKLSRLTGEGSSRVPHLHEDQQVGTVLLGRKVACVAQIVGRVERHERGFSH